MKWIRVITSIDFFGRAAFLFRFTGYLFYLVFLILYLDFIGEPLVIQHALVIIVALVAPFAFIIDYGTHKNDHKTLIKHLTFDLLLMGWYVGILQLNYLPASLFTICTLTNYIASKGLKDAYKFLLVPSTYLVYSLIYGFSFQMTLPNYLIALTLIYSFIHLSSMAYISYQFSRSLYSVKNKVMYQKQEISLQAQQLKQINTTLKDLNLMLEAKVDERTKELAIKNEKLAEYAFINGHQLRAPVATMLGLIQLLDFPSDQVDRADILNKLRHEVKLLDITIKEIRFKLESDHWVNKELDEVALNFSRSNKLLAALEVSDDGKSPSSPYN